jgi:hypothetical protein
MTKVAPSKISGDVVIVDMAAPDTAGVPEAATMLEAIKLTPISRMGILLGRALGRLGWSSPG